MDYWYDECRDLASLKAIPKEKIIVFDTETTGFYANGDDDILQLSIVDGNGKALFNEYFKPKSKEAWPEAEAVNGISPNMVKDAPYIESKADQLRKIFENADLVVAYNLPFDENFINKNGIFIRDDQLTFDVMREFAPVAGEWNDYYGNWKWQKLVNCTEHYGFDFKAHDSLEDAKATAYCFNRMLEDPAYNKLCEPDVCQPDVFINFHAEDVKDVNGSTLKIVRLPEGTEIGRHRLDEGFFFQDQENIFPNLYCNYDGYAAKFKAEDIIRVIGRNHTQILNVSARVLAPAVQQAYDRNFVQAAEQAKEKSPAIKETDAEL